MYRYTYTHAIAIWHDWFVIVHLKFFTSRVLKKTFYLESYILKFLPKNMIGLSAQFTFSSSKKIDGEFWHLVFVTYQFSRVNFSGPFPRVESHKYTRRFISRNTFSLTWNLIFPRLSKPGGSCHAPDTTHASESAPYPLFRSFLFISLRQVIPVPPSLPRPLRFTKV